MNNVYDEKFMKALEKYYKLKIPTIQNTINIKK